MTDTTFSNAYPALKAVDLGDGTYSLAVVIMEPSATVKKSFHNMTPLLKASTEGDSIYLLTVTERYHG
jgi:hypothetical protein